jgi:hypothetical protein
MVMPASERKRGEVGARFHCLLGSGGGVVVMLNAGWGCSSAGEGEERDGEDLLQDLLGLLPCLVSRSYRTRARVGV